MTTKTKIRRTRKLNLKLDIPIKMDFLVEKYVADDFARRVEKDPEFISELYKVVKIAIKRKLLL